MGMANTSYDLADACDSLADAIDVQRKAPGYTETSGEAAAIRN